MNWYKKAQKTRQVEEAPVHLYYQEIGHDPEEGKIDLWAFMDGKLHVYYDIERGDDHYEVWGGKLEDTDYFGRFEHTSKICSVAVPSVYEGRPIPSIILSALYDEFGSDIKIYEW